MTELVVEGLLALAALAVAVVVAVVLFKEVRESRHEAAPLPDLGYAEDEPDPDVEEDETASAFGTTNEVQDPFAVISDPPERRETE